MLDVIKALTIAAEAPKKSGSPKKSGKPQTVSSPGGKPILKILGSDRKGIHLTLFNKGGASREDAQVALKDILDAHWS